MSRSILFVDSYYFSMLQALGLEQRPAAGDSYDVALESTLDFGFGTGGAYTRNFRALGWDAHIVIPNAFALQALWARESGSRSPWRGGWAYGAHLSRLPVVSSMLHRVPHLHGLLLDQIKHHKPDVVFVQDINLLPPTLAREIRKHTGLLVGEIASPLPPKRFLLSYDLIISALPTIVQTATSWGLHSAGVPLGFDERWATTSPASTRPIDAIFIGSFSRLQPQTTPLLQAVARRVPGLKIYGSADPDALLAAGLSEHYAGPAWGKEMFALLGQSKLVVNRHGSIAGDYAVNMRMYESTGSGAALVTEVKSNLAELFEPGTEVLAYSNVEEAADLAAALLADPARLDAVAAAGQARTLRDHSYARRAEQLVEAIDVRLAAS
ncbi:MAG: glycosyltransferase [Salinibacterium sp.]|nr:glycosyltransferase [Salinibacterium sp.]